MENSKSLSAAGRLVAGFALLAGISALVIHSTELRNFVVLLQKARPSLLLVAVVLQLSTYFFAAKLWQTVLRSAKIVQPMRKLLPLSIAKLFADQAVPSAGISGNVLLVEGLVTLGVSRANATTAMAMSIIGYYAAYVALAVAVLLTLWLHKAATFMLAGIVTAFVFVAVCILLGVFLLVSRGGRLPRRLKRFKLAIRVADLLAHVPVRLIRSRALVLRVSLLSALVFVADAATLWLALAAIGYPAAPPTAFIAFMLASIAVTLGPIPMGLGSFEAVCIGVLRTLGVPVEAAVAGTLVLRGFALWLPLAPGLVLARRMVAHGHSRSSS